MAEEEVLDETPVVAKKEKSGGVTLGQLIGIGVVLIAVSVLGTVLVSGKLSSIFGSIDTKMTSLQVTQAGMEAETEGRTRVKACDQVYPLSEDPMIINMADGEHYISAEVAVCVDAGKISEDDFQMRIPQIRHVLNDTLSRISKADLFGAGVSRAQMDEMKELGLEAGGEGKAAFAKNLDKVRGTLIQNLSGNFPWITDVYFTSFLIQ